VAVELGPKLVRVAVELVGSAPVVCNPDAVPVRTIYRPKPATNRPPVKRYS